MSFQPPGGSPPAGWYPDPYGRFPHRYWDGQAWTDHASKDGVASVDPLGGAAARAASEAAGIGRADPAKVQRQVQHQAGIASPGGGGGTVFSEPVLVVNQKAKLIELKNEYAVYDQHGTQIAVVRQVGQTAAKKVLRAISSLDQFMTHRLEVCDLAGRVLLQLTRPAKVFKSTIVVTDTTGAEVGRIVQDNLFGKVHFKLDAGSQTVGSINAENWRAWNFNVQDAAGAEVARITKTWEGMAKTMFTTADNYVVQIHRPLEEPLRSLVVASALSVDTALKQDSRGFG